MDGLWFWPAFFIEMSFHAEIGIIAQSGRVKCLGSRTSYLFSIVLLCLLFSVKHCWILTTLQGRVSYRCFVMLQT